MTNSTSRDPARAGLPLDRWPSSDRLAWQQVMRQARGPFRKKGGGRRPCAATLLKSEKGLRRWLGFLQRSGWLNECELPHERLQPERLDEYFVHLLACGNADRSVVGRFEELQLAFTLMCPELDFRWITRPNGTPLRHMLEMRTKPRFVPGAAEVFAWSEEMFQKGIGIESPLYRCAFVRDALMIAILITRGPRLHALSSLRLGVHVHRHGGEWILDQHGRITKQRKAIEIPLAAEIGAMIDRYVAVERVELLQGGTHDAFWITRYGGPLKEWSLSSLIQRRAKRRFGVAFGPHRFRPSLTTMMALESPETPLDAPLILGHSPSTSLAHYNRAKAVAAGRRQYDRIKRMKQASEKLVQQALGTRRDFFT